VGGGIIGSKRNDSSTIRATPSASGEARIIRNFSNSSSARSEEENRPDAEFEATVAALIVATIGSSLSVETAGASSKFSKGTPNAREILLSVPACGLLVFPLSI
jgi:hypothetical protein